jgi:hypothetical protein
MAIFEDERKLITYCGAFCGSCGCYKGRITAMVAKDFRELITAYVDWVPEYEKIDFNFDDFLRGLDYFANENIGPYCKVACKDGGGAPCKVRPCARERGVEICYDCDDFPCEHFSWILERYPEKLEDCKRYKEIGLEDWLQFHMERARKGYASFTKKYYSQASKK